MAAINSPPDLLLDVDGMMCQKNCATTVRVAIKRCKNVEDAVVTYADREAQIWGKNLNVKEIISEIENVGYDATVKTAGGSQNDADDDPPDMILAIKGMFDSRLCPDKVQRTLMTVDGVISVVVNFEKKTASIWGFAETESLISSLSNAGYTGVDPNAVATSSPVKATSHASSGSVIFNLDKLLKVTQTIPKLESTLNVITGVESVVTDIEAHRVTLYYNTDLISQAGLKLALTELHYYAAVVDSKPLLELVQSSRREIYFEVTGMSCANCANKIDKYLSKAPGVVESGVSCMTNRARVVLDERQEGAVGPRDLMEHIQNMGYGCELVNDDASIGAGGGSSGKGGDKTGSLAEDEINMWFRLLMFSLVFGLPVMILHLSMAMSDDLMMISMEPVMCEKSVYLGQVVMFCLNLPILLFVGYRYYRAAILGAWYGNFGMDCLVMTGTSITFFYSTFQVCMACTTHVPTKHVFFETTGMLLMFVTIGKFIEAFAKGKSVSAITNLLQLQPREAVLVIQQATKPADGSRSSDVLQQHQEVLKTISVDLVQRGDLLKVLPGSGIPTDGRVESGSSYVDESMITGESVAVLKSPGDLVFGSTVNQNSCMYIRVTSLGSESALAQIVKLVETAQMSKAPVQAYADRVAGLFTPAILLTAAVTFSVWYGLSVYGIVPPAWFKTEYNDPLLFSMLFAISVVVISCPCALGLATPTAIMFGTSVGASNGILIKGGSAFEMAHRVTTVVFDKTGTLTEGKPSVIDEIVLEDVHKAVGKTSLALPDGGNHHSSYGSVSPIQNPEQLSRDLLLRIAASAEQRSEHPLAKAIIEAAHLRNIPLLSLGDDSTVVFVGSGVSCVTDAGTVLVGNRGFMEENSISVSSAVDSVMWDLEVQGKTAVCVAIGDKMLGVLGIADVAKAEAFTTVKALKGLGVDVWMLTGDSRTTAEALADELEIPKERVMAGILPKDKVHKVEELQALGQFVAMVGDGVNDSPALAQSDLGVAIGTGTQVAIEAADMVLIRNNLHDLVVALDLAKVVFSRIKWNFVWAIFYNAIAIPYAAGVWFPWTKMLLPPQYAGLAMALSSVSVVVSSMLLRCYKRPAYLNSEVALQKQMKGSMLDRAKRKLNSIKDSIKDSVIQATGKRRGSGPNYQQLPRDEQEADLGLELGLGGLGGLRRSTLVDDSDGIV